MYVHIKQLLLNNVRMFLKNVVNSLYVVDAAECKSLHHIYHHINVIKYVSKFMGRHVLSKLDDDAGYKTTCLDLKTNIQHTDIF